MAITQLELDNFTLRLKGLYEKLKPETLYQRKEELEKETADPDLWKDEVKAKSRLKELSHLKSFLGNLDGVSEGLKSLSDLIKLQEESKDKSLEGDIQSLYRTVYALVVSLWANSNQRSLLVASSM